MPRIPFGTKRSQAPILSPRPTGRPSGQRKRCGARHPGRTRAAGPRRRGRVLRHQAGPALARIEMRDPDDWPILAVALMLECQVWTEDNDFFGTGVPIWTTDRVGIYLADDGSDQGPSTTSP
ncbi:hypothetical protein LEP48_13625 [Isoptericola sp. NEAU-Y5]|uniref:PIN domain-containing protein n=2 Tax=Isoptericola luteus TaxID=2879484 RepID=A0ABS7ZH61_9MICO|nr:hypothetical protein [Isoptericola sp. NEAU-Y5]